MMYVCTVCKYSYAKYRRIVKIYSINIKKYNKKERQYIYFNQFKKRRTGHFSDKIEHFKT